MLNYQILAGNVGGKIEGKDVGDSFVLRFSLATNERVKKQGEYVDEATWHDVEFWGKSAKGIHSFLSSGDFVVVRGTLKKEKYTSKDGVEKVAIRTRADDVRVRSSKPKDGSSPRPSPRAPAAAPPMADTGEYMVDPNDEIPFLKSLLLRERAPAP